MFERTKQFCDSFLEMGVPGFDLAIYKDGEPALRYSNGCSDIENKVKIQGHERYNSYSCSKLITCAAALQLWERGAFSLEDRLSDYMPEFADMTTRTDGGARRAEKPILIRHLFEMTAGFSYETESPQLMKCREETGGRCQTREAMKYLAREPLLFEPGDRWEYSLCHDVLAALVEVISGERFEDYVKRHIFDIAGMKDSTFMLPEEETDTIAAQYAYAEGRVINIGKHITPYKLGREYASGGAGGISTVDDYIKFLEGLRTGLLLEPETLRLMQTDRLTEQQKRTYWTRETHGYGLGVRCPKGDGRYQDFGWGGAASAYAAADTENGITIYFGCHLIASPAKELRPMLYRFARAELLDKAEFAEIRRDLKTAQDYPFPY